MRETVREREALPQAPPTWKPVVVSHMSSDLSNLPNHCSKNNCKWCRTRRARMMARVRRASATVTSDFWETKIGDGKDRAYMDVPYFRNPETLIEPGPRRGIIYLHEKNAGSIRHTKVNSWRKP